MMVTPARSSDEPNAVIFSPVMPTSPTNVPPGVTTVPPFTIVSSCILPSCHPERPVQHVHREIRVLERDAHRRFDPQDVAVQPAFADQHAHLARRLHHVGSRLLR